MPDYDIPDETTGVNYRYLEPMSVYVAWTTVVESRKGCWVSWKRAQFAKYSGGLTHIELAFQFSLPNGQRPVLSCSSAQGVPVTIWFKEIEQNAYDPVLGKWTWLELRMTSQERHDAWRYSRAQIQKPYNAWGLWSFVPYLGCCVRSCVDSSWDGTSWLCSQLVTATLKYALREHPVIGPKLRALHPSEMNPGSALDLIQQLNLGMEQVSTMGNTSILLEQWWNKETEKDAGL